MAIGATPLTVMGNICSDLARRTLATGDEVVSFWVRSNERRFDKDSGAWCDGRHFAVKVTCWRRLAAAVSASLTKGDPVVVSGRVYTSAYERDGVPRSIPELEAVAIGPNLAWCTTEVRRPGRAAPAEPPWESRRPVQPEQPASGSGARDRVSVS